MFKYSPYPADVQALIGTIVGSVIKAGWRGKANVATEGTPEAPVYVITVRVTGKRAAK